MKEILLTVAISLLTIAFTQSINHFLTLKRENKKIVMESYQKFISPMITNLVYYLKQETDFRKGQYNTNPLMKKEIIDFAKSNVMYANPKVAKALIDLQGLDFKEDNRGHESDKYEIRLMYFIVDYCIETLKKTNKREHKTLIKELNNTKNLYGVWAILCEKDLGNNLIPLFTYRQVWINTEEKHKYYFSERKIMEILVTEGWTQDNSTELLKGILMRLHHKKQNLKEIYNSEESKEIIKNE